MWLVWSTLQIQEHGSLFLEPPCNTMGHFSRGHSGRRTDNLFGDEARLGVAEGNHISCLTPATYKLARSTRLPTAGRRLSVRSSLTRNITTASFHSRPLFYI